MLLDNKTEVPACLNKDFFKAALEDGLHENHIDIREIIFDVSSEGGENYCSKIYRVKIIYERSKSQFDEARSVIVKSITITPATQFLEDLAVFFREKIFYLDVLGKLELLIADGSKFGPNKSFEVNNPFVRRRAFLVIPIDIRSCLQQLRNDSQIKEPVMTF